MSETCLDKQLVSCHVCHKVCHAPVSGLLFAFCPRCGGALSLRKTDSLRRTWAFLITAMILYIPANLYPIMTVTSLGKGKPDTILSGIFSLYNQGLWYLALVVFFASIFVPLVKIIGLAFLLLSVQFKTAWHPILRTRLYHFIEKIGRWSMLDVFMVSVMIAVVSLGNVAKVYADVGLRFFGLVVVFTMFATLSFDCRLVWDATSPEGKKR